MSAKLTLKQYFAWRKYVMSLHMPHCAIILLDYLEINQGENWLFHETNIKKDTGLKGKDTFYKAKSELLNAGLITWQGQKNGIKIRVNYDIQKTDVQNLDVQKSDVQNPDNIERKKTERKGENKRKGENSHTSSSVASAPAGAAASVCVPPQPASIPPKTETVPPEEQTSPVRPRNRKQTVPVSENPPSLEDIKAYIPEVLRGKGITGWTEQDIHSTAYDIWNRYTNNRWTTAKGDPMYSWENAVTGWILRNNGIPQRMAPLSQQQGQPQNGKSFKQQERDYANRYLIDPIGTAISDCVNQSIIAGGDPCDWGLAPQFHDEAMKLMETRKEQALSGHTPAAPIDIFGIGFGGKE